MGMDGSLLRESRAMREFGMLDQVACYTEHTPHRRAPGERKPHTCTGDNVSTFP